MSWLIGKDSDAGRDWGQEEKGTTEDEMAVWHHWLDGCEFEWTPGVGDGQGGLACWDSWGRKELDTTERLIWCTFLLNILIGAYITLLPYWYGNRIMCLFQFLNFWKVQEFELLLLDSLYLYIENLKERGFPLKRYCYSFNSYWVPNGILPDKE